MAWSTHTGTYIPADVDEDLCVRFFRGESMDAACAEKTEGTSTCSRVIGLGSRKKGKQQCRQCDFSFRFAYFDHLQHFRISRTARFMSLKWRSIHVEQRARFTYLWKKTRSILPSLCPSTSSRTPTLLHLRRKFPRMLNTCMSKRFEHSGLRRPG